ncbi:MAG: glycosyltransferase [Burkholderiales bacterium]|nr:MAG: glycosyltransferase [Burkholderiales bacterium]
MKILAVTTKSPYPLNEGRALRTYNLLRQLALHHEVHLVSFVQTQEDVDGLGAMRAFCATVEAEPLYLDHPRLRLAADACLEPFGAVPLQVIKYRTAGMRRRLARLLERHTFDAVHLDMLHLAEYLPMFPHATRVLTEHNVESALLARRADTETRPLQRAYLRYQTGKLARYEARACAAADEVVAVSEPDAALLRAMDPAIRVTTVPNGVDTGYFRADPDVVPEPGRMAFVGGFTWFPNLDAIRWFVDTTLPRIAEAVPQARLTVVGRQPDTAATRAIAADPRVELTGGVDDIRPIVSRASVFVVPLRIGGGTRLKILDALSMGRAVVSTRIGCEGLDVEPGRSILIADDPESLARETARVLADPELAARLGAEGRALVERRYDWRVIARDLDRVYRAPPRSGADAPRAAAAPLR